MSYKVTMNTNKIKEAARFVLEKGYTHQQAADNLGISLSAIGRWVRAERGSTTDGGPKEVALNLADQAELVRLRPENEQLRMEREIIKKAGWISSSLLCKGNRMKYGFIREQLKTYPVTVLCRVMQVSTSVFYVWLKAPADKNKHMEKLDAKAVSNK